MKTLYGTGVTSVPSAKRLGQAMRLSISTNRFRRVRISAAQMACLKDEHVVGLIVDVYEPGYVPDTITIQARITDLIFTGTIEARNLPSLEQDLKVKSAAVGKQKT